MPFFTLGHKVSLPSLRHPTSDTAGKPSKLRRKFGRSQLSISSPSVAGSTAGATGDIGGKRSFYFPEIFPHSGSRTHLKMSRSRVDPGREFSVSSPCLSLPPSDRPLPAIPRPTFNEEVVSPTKDKLSSGKDHLSTSNLVSTSPMSALTPVVPQICPSRQLSRLPADFANRPLPPMPDCGPLNSHPVTEEDAAFLARLCCRELPPVPNAANAADTPVAAPSSSSHLVSSDLVPEPLKVPNRATHLVRTRTPYPVRSMRLRRSLHIQTRFPKINNPTSHTPSPSPSHRALVPHRTPKRLTMIPEVTFSSRMSVLREPDSTRLTICVAPEVDETKLVAPNAPRMSFAVLAIETEPTSAQGESMSAVQSLISINTRQTLFVTRLKRMGLLAGHESAPPTSSIAVLADVDVDAGLDEAEEDEALDADVGYGDETGLQFLGYGSAMLLCGRLGLMRAVAGEGQVWVQRCLKV